MTREIMKSHKNPSRQASSSANSDLDQPASTEEALASKVMSYRCGLNLVSVISELESISSLEEEHRTLKEKDVFNLLPNDFGKSSTTFHGTLNLLVEV